MTPERRLEELLIKRCKALGWLTRKVQWIGRRGAPDRIVIRNGVVRFLELKGPAGRLTPHQTAELARLQAAGVDARVIRTAAELEEALT